ncbi:MAG TPA: sulfatase [Saprospiraceae bacterium]|nr:sulfatase [Saprospiraceae bacterium]
MIYKSIMVLITLLTFSIYCIGQIDQKPNIIIFFVDDMGWADWGLRNPAFNTPNLDQLKKEGMEFTRAYVATPTCSPSRASLLTGKEPIRFLMPRHVADAGGEKKDKEEFNYWPSDPANMPSRNWLPLNEITYAERLKDFGYYNQFIGKWHLGEEAFYPIHQGFDNEIGVTPFGQPGNYYPPYWKKDNPFPKASNEYLTDLLTDKAVSFIKDYKEKKPFELSFYHYGVHSPLIGKNELIAHYKSLGWEDKYAHYGAMVSAVDESLGRLRKALKEKGIENNTIIIFTSDQGGYFSNYPLRGKKLGGNTLGEGGARVPFIIHWPGQTKAGAECDVPTQTLDVYPTLIEWASGKPCTDTQIQGKSLIPLLLGHKFPERKLYFFRSYEDQYTAIIDGDWKLIKYHKGETELYNIKKDSGEVSNLIYNNPSIAKQLLNDLLVWEKQAVPTF